MYPITPVHDLETNACLCTYEVVATQHGFTLIYFVWAPGTHNRWCVKNASLGGQWCKMQTLVVPCHGACVKNGAVAARMSELKKESFLIRCCEYR